MPPSTSETRSGVVSPVSFRSPSTSRSSSPSQALRRAADAPSAAQLKGSDTSSPQMLAMTTGPDARRSLDASSKLPRPSRPDARPDDGIPLRWPVSPRLKSPPPSAGSRRNSVGSTSRSDLDLSDSDSHGRRSTQEPPPQQDQGLRSPTSVQSQGSGAVKVPRGSSALAPTLETVEEGEHSISPRHTPMRKALGEIFETSNGETRKDNEGREKGRDEDRKPGPITHNKEEQSKRSDGVAKAPGVAQKRSHSTLNAAKLRPNTEGSSRNMTVETETVSSIPQTAASKEAGERGVPGKRDDGGTLRTKPSNETIRPRKERKKVAKKPSSTISGALSSKADLFEQKVASAVDEGESDSDETFVYESNPPEPRARRHRHHSRTPSTTSLQSLGDRRIAGRSAKAADNQRGVKGKRSMKFTSNHPAGSSMDDESGDRDAGTYRGASSRSAAATNPSYQHFSLHGRGHGPSNGPQQLDPDSPFSQASRARHASAIGSRVASRPGSPRSSSPAGLLSPTRKGTESSFQFRDDLVGDERTPLMGSVSSDRKRGNHLYAPSNLNYEFYPRRERTCASNFFRYLAVVSTVLLLILLGSGLVYTTTQPLSGVRIREIENVLASEEELMFDLLVEGLNPNLLAIQVADMDVNIFAKSRHVGSPDPHSHGASAAAHGPADLVGRGGVDHGTDPIDDPAGDPQTMLLGQILAFDAALSFEPSPVRRHVHPSVGSVRLARPANRTAEPGAQERWLHVLQSPFTLIVRGVLKYQLPLSSRQMRAAVGASVVVHPEDGVDGSGAMRLEPVRRPQSA